MLQIEKKESDFSVEEVDQLKSFKEKGLPGITQIKETNTFSWFNLYMSDKSYQEIADITRSDKNLILYLSDKLDWFGKKMSYYDNAQGKISAKLSNTKLKSLDFLTTLAESYGKVYGSKLNIAIMNNDFRVLDDIDPKQMSVYFKSLEMIQKLTTTPQSPKSNNMSVNVNLNNETQIKKVDENTLVISPSNQSEIYDEMLQLQKELDESD